MLVQEKIITVTKEENTTTKVVEKVTEKKTEAPTEEPTTLPYVKVTHLSVNKKYAEYFYDLVVENGSVISMNDIVPDDDVDRGNLAFVILHRLDMDTKSFTEKYFPLGYQNPEIPYEDNYCIEYTGNKKYIFKYTHEDKAYNAVYFDFCVFR